MRLTRPEIVLLAALLTALLVGGLAQKFRRAHPANLVAPKPVRKK
ncbi:MAG TPA: hypothetical protein VGM54_16005 [Chthoniobacter sp.]|jgi:hypothetical protein